MTATAVLSALAVMTGCSSPIPQTEPLSSSKAVKPSPIAAPSTVSQFVPHWMALDVSPSWTEPERRITAEFQQFGLRPVGEDEVPSGCNGCGVEPATAVLTAYAAGRFTPGPRTGDAASVRADGDGFFRAEAGEVTLTWPYADNAWATLRARTTLSRERARMLELARALHPGEVTNISVPLSIPALPASLPLSEIYVDNRGYGTTLHFAGCAANVIGRIPDCYGEADNVRVQIWPADGYHGHIDERDSVIVDIGGRSGIYDARGKTAAVQVGPGMLVVFEVGGPGVAKLPDILKTLVWAPDPGDPQTWPAVAEWTTSS